MTYEQWPRSLQFLGALRFVWSLVFAGIAPLRLLAAAQAL